MMRPITGPLRFLHRQFSVSSSFRSQTLAAFGQEKVFKGVGRLAPIVLDQGEGCWVTLAPDNDSLDAQISGQGRRMLDFTSGIGVTNLGHCHPEVTKAVQEQVGKIVHAQINIGFSRPYLKLIEALQPVMPHESLNSFFFWNSGAEAVEAAIKLARHATGRQNIIAFQGSYHGRTMGTMALTKSKTIYSAGYLPYMPGVHVAPFPYWHQLGVSPSTSESEMAQLCLEQIELLLLQQTAPKDTAAFIIEPVLGEGGYVPASEEFMMGLRKICDREGILLIVDEVQSGFGRTGKYFSISQIAPELRPDIMVMAKGIANGFPLSGIVANKALSDKQPPGSQGGTYAGNAVSCAAGVACAAVMKDGSVLDNVNARSKELFAALHKLKEDPETSHLIADIRGLGLMVGIEFASNKPFPTSKLLSVKHGKIIPDHIASRVQNKCYEKGMLTLTTSVYQVIRLISPLIVSKEEMAEGISILTESIREVAKEG